MTSEIKADKWSPASGTAGTIGDNGDTFTVPSGVTLDIASGATADFTGATVTGLTDNNTWVLLDDTYISSSTASVTYSSSLITDTYEQYVITGSAIQVASAGSGNIALYVSADNGSSYYSGGTDYSRSVYVGQSALSSNTVISRSGDAGAVEVTGNAYDFGQGSYGNASFVVRCFNLRNLATGSGARRLFELFSVYMDKDSTSNFVCNQGMAFFKGATGEINNIKLSLSHSNTFGEGEFRLYGLK